LISHHDDQFAKIVGVPSESGRNGAVEGASVPSPAVPTDTLATTKDLQVLESRVIAELHKEIAELTKTMMRVALMMVAAFAGALVTVALVV
jgi:hypothetical protein